MKKFLPLLLVLITVAGLISCKKSSDNNTTTTAGVQSPMGAVGTLVTAGSSTANVSHMTASVTTLTGGVSSYSGSAIITDANYKNMLSNVPGITISGDSVRVTGFNIKQTLDGIECQNPIGPGTVVNYASNVGDTYTVGSTGRTRTVTYKSTTDEFPYAGMYIKVIQVVEPTPGLKSIGLSKITYTANHKFGLVAVYYDFTDGSSANFSLATSTTNGK